MNSFKEKIGYVFSYTDVGETCDGYPRISSLYKTKDECLKEMKSDAKSYNKEHNNEGEITYKKDCIEIDFSQFPECYCLYKIHEVYSICDSK